MPTLSLLAGPTGIQPGDELTFFYPYTEWAMAQPFDCFCGAATCRGRIAGARDMTAAQLEGQWLNGWIRDLLEERDAGSVKGNGINGKANGNGHVNGSGGHSQIENGSKNTLLSASPLAVKAGPDRSGPTSRELSGEMGGDTSSA